MKHFGALILLLGIAAQPSASEAAAAATATPGAASVAPTVAVVPATSLANAEWPEGYLAVCFVVKNQHEDLKEWLTYQEYIGVSRVYLYDNNSTVRLSGVAAPWISKGFVDYTFYEGHPRIGDNFTTSNQWSVYQDCIERNKHRHRWLSFIDADEFFVLLDSRRSNLPEFLKDFEMYGGLAVNWQLFGSSGHIERPKAGVLASYTSCLQRWDPENKAVKVIANTKHLMQIGGDPHHVLYDNPYVFTVNEKAQRVDAGLSEFVSVDRIALYHYALKSQKEYEHKAKRGSAAGNHKTMKYFRTLNAISTDTCTRGVELAKLCCSHLFKNESNAAPGDKPM